MNDRKQAAVEAILFSVGHEVAVSDLAEALSLSEEELRGILTRLKYKYNAPRSGLQILFLEDKVQLGAKPAHYGDLLKMIEKPREHALTETMLETLAIIAYRQPVTRMDIEKIRGVKSDYALNSLIEDGLVCERGRMDAPGKPLLFGTTDEFLRHFGISSVGEMPTFAREELAGFRSEAARRVGELTGEPLEEEQPGGQVPETAFESEENSETS